MDNAQSSYVVNTIDSIKFARETYKFSSVWSLFFCFFVGRLTKNPNVENCKLQMDWICCRGKLI